MTKIVYNACFGGASLSDEAIERYAELKGIKLYKSVDIHWGVHNYYLVPQDEYNRIREDEDITGKTEYDGYSVTSYERSNALFFSRYNFLEDRTDPLLVQVIEELRDKANGNSADLQIRELPAGTKYYIHEYDGSETVMTPDDYKWKIA